MSRDAVRVAHLESDGIRSTVRAVQQGGGGAGGVVSLPVLLGAVLLVGMLSLLVVTSSALAESYEEAVEGTSGVSHFWPMGETSGSSFADVVGGATGELSGGVTLGEPGGLVGDSSTAALFDGSSGAAQAPVDLSGSGRLTVEFWMKWKTFGDDDALALEFTPNFNEHAGGFLVDPSASDGGGTFAVGVGEGGSRNNVFFAQPSAEQWHYYAFVIDTEGSGTTEITPYVDGHAVSYTKSASGTGGGFADSTLYWMSRDASSLFGAGSMQDLALYDGALSSGTILEHYEIGEGGPKAFFSSSPVDATVGVPVRLNASASSSPSGITDYAWDFDGSKTYSSDTGSSTTATHTFSSAGTYTVDLRVKDGIGKTATVSHTVAVGAALGSYEQAVEDAPGVLHFWPMGESSGSSLADVFDGADAMTSGGVTLGEPGGLVGDPSKSALFDGSSGAAQAPVDLSGTGKLTVEFWMKWKTFGDDDALALEFTPNFNEHAGGFLVDPSASDGGGTFGVGVGDGASRNNVFFAQPSAEQWHDYAFVIDTEGSGATEITPYVDGHAVSYTKSASGTGGGFADSTLYWMSRDASSLFGAGSMQDLALYDETLSSSTILEHYDQGESTYDVVNTIAPSIEGTARDGQTLTASPGSWTGFEPISYAYRWQSCDNSGGSCSDISGATGSTYVLGHGDVGTTLRVVVTASNAGGSASVSSEASAVVSASQLVYVSQFGSEGAGDGQFDHPGDVAIGLNGDLFVLDQGNDRVEVFNGSGEYLRQFGSEGSGNGQMSGPDGLAVDSEGDVWVLDTGNGRIEEFSESGVFMRTAGAGLIGSAEGIAVDRHGDVWVSATYEGHLVEFSDEGEYLKTVGSEGSEPGQLDEPEGISVDENGHVWVAEWANNRVQEFNEAGEYLSTFGSAGLGAGEIGLPYGITADGGHVFVGEVGNDRVQEFDEEGRFVEQLGTQGSKPGQLELSNPVGLAINSAGGVWITDPGNDRVEEWTPSVPVAPSNTALPTISGTTEEGQMLSASAGSWEGTSPLTYVYQWQDCDSLGEGCMDIAGATSSTYMLQASDVGSTLRVTVTASNAVGSATSTSEETAVIASDVPPHLSYAFEFGSPGNGEGQFEDPAGVALDGRGDLWVLDRGNNRVEEFDEAGEYLQQFGSEGGGDGQMERPSALAVSSEGDVWVLDSLNDRIEEFSEDGVFLRASENTLLEDAEGMAIAPNGDIWVAATAKSRLVVFNRYGQLLKAIGRQGSGPGELLAPRGIAIGNGHVWAAESRGWQNSRVEVFDEAGEYKGEIKSPAVNEAEQVAVSGGHVFVADRGSQRVEVFDEDGSSVEDVGSYGSGPGQFKLGSAGIAVNSVGDLWVVDAGNHRVEEWTPEDGEFAAPANTNAPSISGAAGVGQTLVANPGTWGGSPLPRFAYQWERCDASGSECVAIEGAKRSTYVPAQDEVGSTLRVLVTATNSSGSASSVSPATAVVGVPPENVSEPSISGEAQDGKTLSASTGVWEGSPPLTYAYQWQRCLEGGFEGAEAPFGLFDPSCVDIEGATGSSYTLQDADVESVVRVIVSASDVNGETSAASQPTATVVSPAPPENTAPPTVSGTAEEGQILDASTGEWHSVGRVSYAYQWQRCDAAGEACASIEGATGATYVPEAADLHGTLRVTVTASNGAGSAGATSRPSGAVAQAPPPENTAVPAIAGMTVDGRTLTASTGAWGGAQPMSYAYQWESCNPAGGECAPVEGATEPEYEARDGDIGSTLRAIVTATNAGGSAQATSAASPVIEAEATGELQAPSISGTPNKHEVLYADAGVWSGSEVKVSYQWESCDSSGSECAPVQGATGPEYDLAEGDVGTTLRVRVGAASRSASLTDVSPPTPVIGTQGALASASPPSISGTPRSGESLSASTGNWSAGESASYAYEWQRCDAFGVSCEAIPGATEADYAVAAGDAGHTLRVLVTASAEGHQAERLSAATQPVAAAGAPVVEQPPSIEGTALTGYTLSAGTGAWSGEGQITYTYQWERCTDAGECAPIEDATKSPYTLAEADRGSRVRVAVTAEGPGGSSTAISDPTADIEPQPLVQFSSPSISGAVQDGATLSAEAGIWSGSGPVSYAYQWESCNPAGTECAPIEGATESSYTIGDGDQGSTLRVDVTVTNPQGSASTFSATTPVVPGGELSSEAALEVAQQTDPALLAPATTVSIEEKTIAPALHESEEELASQGTLTSSSISKETAGAFAVNTAEGELSMTPMDSLPTATSMPTIVNEAAALFANTWPATDTIVRPEPLGASATLQIRSPEAPRSFSWEVGLGPDQQLEQLPNGSVAVINAPENAGLPGETEEPSGTPDTEAGQPETPAEEAEAEKEETESKEAEAKGETEAELPTEPLPSAPLASTPPAESTPGEPQPQNTQAQYETAAGAMSSAETQTAGKALMVIPAPTVVDAAGDSVPASLSITGDTITLTIKPGPTTTYPTIAGLTIAAPTDKVSAERDPVRYGLSDEHPTTFAKEENGEIVEQSALDPNLQGTGTLKVTTARIVVPYNVFSKPNPQERPRLKKWLEAVKIAGLKPYITLGPNQTCKLPKKAKTEAEKKADEKCYVPSLSEYLNGVKDLIHDEPGVKLWGAWNEPDIGKFPLEQHAHRAAEYWQEAQYAVEHKHDCGCKVIAGEFAFAGKYEGHYISKYRETIDDYKNKYPPCHTCTHSRPQIWGFHDYKDVADRNSAFAERFDEDFLGRKNKARVWIGEAGVELQNGGPELTELARGSTLAEIRDKQRAAAKEFEDLHKVSSRIERIYYYSYGAPSQKEQKEGEDQKPKELPFDSGLVSNVGEARPAYCVLLFSTHECPAPTVVAESRVVGVVRTEKFNFQSEAEIPLYGSIDPNGSPVSYEFEHGPTTAYGYHTQPASGGAGSTAFQVKACVTGNESFTTIESHGTEHFRVVAHSGGSPYYSPDGTVGWSADENIDDPPHVCNDIGIE
jgi:sugar lactone lactonase YvrE